MPQPSTDARAAKVDAPAAPRRAWLAWLVTAAAILLVNAVVLRNALEHEPAVGYDVPDHLGYARVLSTGHLPDRKQSREFFSAPLAYAPPAVVAAVTGEDGDRPIGRSWQLANVFYSLVLCVSLAAVTGRLVPQDGRWSPYAAAAAVLILGTLPVYYKTFAQARAEPLLATLAVVALWAAMRLCAKPGGRAWRWAAFGLVLGSLPLTRQWGVFAAAPLGVIAAAYAVARLPLKTALGRIALAVAVSGLTCGWFYVSLQVRFGSMTAFNQKPQAFDLAKHPRSAYLDWPLTTMAGDPTRPNLNYRFGPLLYSDFWGDYWGYFLLYSRRAPGDKGGRYFTGRDAQRQRASDTLPERTNYDTVPAYLGRVNVVSALPSLILLSGVAWGLVAGAIALRRRPDVAAGRLLASTLVLASSAGYFWFVVSYTDDKTDEIKASYLLQVVPCLALLSSAAIFALARRHPRLAAAALATFALAAVHNARAFWSVYV